MTRHFGIPSDPPSRDRSNLAAGAGLGPFYSLIDRGPILQTFIDVATALTWMLLGALALLILGFPFVALAYLVFV